MIEEILETIGSVFLGTILGVAIIFLLILLDRPKKDETKNT